MIQRVCDLCSSTLRQDEEGNSFKIIFGDSRATELYHICNSCENVYTPRPMIESVPRFTLFKLLKRLMKWTQNGP